MNRINFASVEQSAGYVAQLRAILVTLRVEVFEADVGMVWKGLGKRTAETIYKSHPNRNTVCLLIANFSKYKYICSTERRYGLPHSIYKFVEVIYDIASGS